MGRVTRISKIAALLVVRGLWLSTLVILPLFGMWLASSLAAYHNATQWLSLLIGLLLFPIVPVGWDLIFVWRMRRRADRKPILTRVDRLVLRTLIVNVIVAIGLLWQKPVTVYQALSVRGDWMLDGHDGAAARWTRARLFTVADWFRRGWTPGGTHHYGASDRAPSQPPPPPPPPPAPLPDEPATADELDAPDAPGAPEAPLPPEPAPDAKGWPMPATIDPIVLAMPADAQTSIASVGAYLAANIADPRQRVKAVHDFVVRRLSYDDAALHLLQSHHAEDAPPMDAESVFARGSGVCAGYAHLMSALGAAAGLEIKYITGFARGKRAGVADDAKDDDVVGLGGNEHAWNAAQLDGYWYPIDATWDDGDGDDYSTVYLLTPPAVFLLDHFPAQPAWQLVADQKTVADFLRQPALNAAFIGLGLELRSPDRSQVSVSGSIDLVIDNPRRRDVMATVAPADSEIGGPETRNCGYTVHDQKVRLRCGDLGDGEWRVDLWASRRGVATLSHGGSIWVNSR